MGGVTLPVREDPVKLNVLWFKLPLFELGVLNKLDELLAPPTVETRDLEHKLPW